MEIDTTFSALLVESAANSLWQGILATVAVLLLLRLVPGMPARGRYFTWWGTLLLLALIPAQGWGTETVTEFEAPAPTRVAGPLPPEAEMPAEAAVARRAGARLGEFLEDELATGSQPDSIGAEAIPPFPSSPDEVGGTPPLRLTGGSWTGVLALLWLAGVLIQLLRLGRGALHLKRLAREALPLPVALESRLVERWGRLGVGSRIHLRHSKSCTMPTALGLGFRKILIPSDLLGKLSESELEQVVLHETAHLKRADDWTQPAQKLVEALFFFHPVVIWIGRRLDLERELACDEWVVSRTGSAQSYAASLARLAELTRWPRRPVVAPGAAVTRAMVSRRIEMILKRSVTSSRGASGKGLLPAGAVLLGLFLLLTRLGPLVELVEAAPLEKSVKTQDSAHEEAAVAASSLEEKAGLANVPSPGAFPRPVREPEGEAGIESTPVGEEIPEEARDRERWAEEIWSRTERQALEAVSRMTESRLRMQVQEALQRAAEVAERRLMEKVPAIIAGAERVAEEFGVPLAFFSPPGAPLSEEELVPLLEQIVLEDPDPRVRSAAIHGLVRLRSDLAVAALMRLYDRVTEPDLRRQILVNQLVRARADDTEVLELLSRVAVNEPDLALRRLAFNALAASEKGTEFLITIYREDPDVEVRKALIGALVRSRSTRAAEHLKSVARSDPDPDLRLEAVRRLSSGGPWALTLPETPVVPMFPFPPEQPEPPPSPPSR